MAYGTTTREKVTWLLCIVLVGCSGYQVTHKPKKKTHHVTHTQHHKVKASTPSPHPNDPRIEDIIQQLNSHP